MIEKFRMVAGSVAMASPKPAEAIAQSTGVPRGAPRLFTDRPPRSGIRERHLPGKLVLVAFQDEIDTLADVDGDGHLRSVMQKVQTLVLLRRDVDGRRDFLPGHRTAWSESIATRYNRF